MTEQQFPDPLNEALARTGERGVQVVSIVAAVNQQALRWRAAMNEKNARRRAAELRALELERQRARLLWAPAHDRAWLSQADLLQTARVWGAALPYADRGSKQFDPTAGSAMHKCETRLRTLHPHAMSRYDRLRQDGWEPAAAMREAAPLFDRPPNVHESGPAAGAHGALTAAPPGTIPERGAVFTLFPHGPSKSEYLAVRRAHRITENLTASAHEQGRRPLGREDLRTVLEAVTNLTPDIIDHVTSAIPEASRAGDIGLHRSMAQREVAAERARAADLNTAVDDLSTPSADERTDQIRDSFRQSNAATAYRSQAPADPVSVADLDFPFTAQQVVDAAHHGPGATFDRAPASPSMRRVYNGRQAGR